MREFGEWLDTATVPLWSVLLITVALFLAGRLVSARWQARCEARCRLEGHQWEAVGDDEMWCRRCRQTGYRYNRGGRRGR